MTRLDLLAERSPFPKADDVGEDTFKVNGSTGGTKS